MPSGWRPVPAYKQSYPGRCLPACVRMVLAYYGDKREEDDLARLLQSRRFGTRASNVRRLEVIGYSVTYGQTTLAQLKDHLANNIPPIVFLQTGPLPYWEENVNHAVVLVGMTVDQAYVLDPAFDSVQSIPLDAFQLAWSDFDYTFAVVTK